MENNVRRNLMFLFAGGLVLAGGSMPAHAEDFPFGRELTLEAAPAPGSNRLPTLTIGANGEAEAGLWCRTLRGQFSVAGETLIFIPGASDQAQCSPALAARDRELEGALAGVTDWSMQGEALILNGAQRLVYRINTN